MIQPKYHIFICTSNRVNGTQKGFCHQQGSVDLVQTLMQEIDDRELSGDVMMTNTGCFGICDKGPVAVVYPEGIWYGSLTPEKIERICEEHFENGEPVKEYMI